MESSLSDINRKTGEGTKRATKLVIPLRNYTYEERLRRLKLPTLKYRRIRGNMIECIRYLWGNMIVI